MITWLNIVFYTCIQIWRIRHFYSFKLPSGSFFKLLFRYIPSTGLEHCTYNTLICCKDIISLFGSIPIQSPILSCCLIYIVSSAITVNIFVVISLVDVDMIQYPKSNNEVLLLSKCIDTTFDLEESSYTLSSETYKGSYYYSSNTIGHFNKFEEGSFMRITENKEYYGRLIEADNGKKIYHYAIGFVI